MKIRLEVDAARSRLGRLVILDGAHRYGPFDACATADDEAARAAGNAARDALRPGGPAPLGTYAMKNLVAVDDERRHDLGDTAVMFEPRSGDARRAESLGRLVLALHGGALGADGRMRPTSAGVRLGADALARVVAAVRSNADVELEIVEVPLSIWDWLFFWRRRPSRGYVGDSSTRSSRDDDDWGSSTSSSSSSSTSSRGDSFSGGGGSFGGAGASGSWSGASTGAVAAGAALGVAGAAAASESGSSESGSSDWGGSANDDTSSGSDGGGDSDSGTSY